MKFLNITEPIQGYTIDELEGNAKDKAISDHIEFLLTCIPYENQHPDIQKAIDKAEDMRTPWFTPSYIIDYAYDQIIDDIRIHNYLFSADGNIIPLITGPSGEVIRIAGDQYPVEEV